MAFLSICIPVYNGEKYIDKCLNSLIEMTDVQIICVDDGSKDDSLNILKEYEINHNNIVVLSQTNQGQSSARNRALEIAEGKYIAFVDIDDMLETRSIDLLKDVDDKYDVDFVQFGVVSDFPNWSMRKQLLFDKSKLLDENEYKLLYSFICGYKDNRDLGPDYFGLVSCKFYKKKLIDGLRFVSNIVGEDTLFACEAGLKVKKAYFLSEYLYHYTSNDGSYSHKIMQGIIPKSATMLNNMKMIMDIGNTNESLYMNAFYNRCLFMFNWCLQAMGFYTINEKNYRMAILSDIFNNEVYKEMLNNIDYLYIDEKIKMLLNLLKNNQYNEVVTYEFVQK